MCTALASQQHESRNLMQVRYGRLCHLSNMTNIVELNTTVREQMITAWHVQAWLHRHPRMATCFQSTDKSDLMAWW